MSTTAAGAAYRWAHAPPQRMIGKRSRNDHNRIMMSRVHWPSRAFGTGAGTHLGPKDKVDVALVQRPGMGIDADVVEWFIPLGHVELLDQHWTFNAPDLAAW